MAIGPLIDDAAGKLREVMAQLTSGIEAHDVIIPARDQVIGRFGELFAPERIPQLSAEEFKSFLVFKNNRHWTGLNRHQESMCQDVPKLRAWQQRRWCINEAVLLHK